MRPFAMRLRACALAGLMAGSPGVFAQAGNGTPANPPPSMQQMQNNLARMQSLMQQMQTTRNPQERQRLLEQHAQLMQENMQVMMPMMMSMMQMRQGMGQGMGGMGGGMMTGPSANGGANPPVRKNPPTPVP